MNAGELADLIVEKKVKTEQKAYDNLKEKVARATTQMLSDMSMSEVIELTDNDMLALTKVTESLREMGYRFRFIEVQDSSGETVKHKLLVSIEHLA